MKLELLDWKLLDGMSDEKQYTQGYFSDDVEPFSDDSHNYIRQRVGPFMPMGWSARSTPHKCTK